MTHNNKWQGFTIIEVLMVLAIGGLMITMVFAAIPFITRSNQNNQRKDDVAILLQRVSDYRLHNSGAFPGSATDLDLSGINKLKFYDSNSNVSIIDNRQDLAVANTDITKVKIYNYSLCDTDSARYGSTVAGGSRDIVALFALDKGSGASNGSPQCKEM